MKKNKMMRIASVLLVAVLLSTCVISGTFAKYTTSITGNDTAKVAKFAVSAFGTSSVNTQTQTIDIFNVSSIYDSEGIQDAEFETATGVDDTNVANGTDVAIIAPGTWGKFTYTLTNTSDVLVSYTIDYTVTEAGVPLKWSVDGKTWTEDLADVTTPATLAISTGTADVTIYWKWAFEGDNAADTTLGATGTATPSVTIAVTFTQVD